MQSHPCHPQLLPYSDVKNRPPLFDNTVNLLEIDSGSLAPSKNPEEVIEVESSLYLAAPVYDVVLLWFIVCLQ